MHAYSGNGLPLGGSEEAGGIAEAMRVALAGWREAARAVARRPMNLLRSKLAERDLEVLLESAHLDRVTPAYTGN